MKILIVDSLFVVGHIHPNTHYINLLAKDNEVSVISIEGLFANLTSTVNVIELEEKYKINDIRKSRIKQVFLFRKIKRIIKNGAFDAIIFLSYDIESFAVGRLFLPSNRIVAIQEHNNIDRLSKNSIHFQFYKTFCNRVEHIVYEDYMKEALVNDYGVNPDRVFVLPRARFAYEVCETDKRYSAIGLSRSNSDSYISELMATASSHIEEFEGMKLVLKVHDGFEGKSPVIETLTNRVSDQEYKEFFNSTRVVLDPLPNSFKFRMSAVLFEALSSRKVVIGSDAQIIKYFAGKYPHICFAAKDPLDMLRLTKNVSCKETEAERKDFDAFMSDYSDERTMEVFNKILSKNIPLE